MNRDGRPPIFPSHCRTSRPPRAPIAGAVAAHARAPFAHALATSPAARSSSEIRESAIHRLVQGARRAQQAAVADRRRTQARRRRHVGRQSRARRRLSRGPPRIPATIVMPEGTPFTKVKHTRDFGARVVHRGRHAFAKPLHARARARRRTQISPSSIPIDDPMVIAGQGTRGARIPRAGARDRHAGRAHRRRRADLRHRHRGQGAQARHRDLWRARRKLYPSMYDALKGEKLPCGGQTIAEGIAVKEPGTHHARRSSRALVDGHPAGRARPRSKAPSSRCWKSKRRWPKAQAPPPSPPCSPTQELFTGRKVGIVISGGNIDMRLLSNVILRELAREGRILSLDHQHRGPARPARARRDPRRRSGRQYSGCLAQPAVQRSHRRARPILAW